MWLSPPEEMIWSKAFVQERERYDGADVIHLLRELGPTLDWPRLLMRFGDRWRVLLSFIDAVRVRLSRPATQSAGVGEGRTGPASQVSRPDPTTASATERCSRANNISATWNACTTATAAPSPRAP